MNKKNKILDISFTSCKNKSNVFVNFLLSDIYKKQININ